MVADIQRFSLHDGPGIRTSVFLKGCNMHCAWCHNPETIHPWPETMLNSDACVHCGKCDQGCYSGARRLVGQEMTAEQVMDIVLLDRNYYGDDGGMTITGGEPVLQAGFSASLLALAAENGIHCAIETNLAMPCDELMALVSGCNLVMCDVKIWDCELHRRYTGLGNERILENLKAVDNAGVPVIVRTPVIEGINDDASGIEAIARFLGEMKHLQCYELLPYHPLGTSKMVEGMPPQQRFSAPSGERMEYLAAVAKRYVRQIRVSAKAFDGKGE